ncbi:hypothetical protein Btru_057986 [Bulinus truncatus]|nr:hypothetical protein Btru_057986 [Bulinus truncatus]
MDVLARKILLRAVNPPYSPCLTSATPHPRLYVIINMRQGFVIKLLLSGCLSCFFLIAWSIYDMNFNKASWVPSNITGFNCVKYPDDMAARKPVKRKLMLFYRFPDFYELKNIVGLKALDSCDKKCELILDDSRFDEADVVVFYSHLHTIDHKPPPKAPGQKWVFFSVESPLYGENDFFGEYRWWNKFDWTMSYRYDSEFWHGYIQMRPRATQVSQKLKSQDQERWRKQFANKTKMVAWFVSHCDTDSQREKYVKQLSKFISVDIYGKCGPLKCEDRTACLELLNRDYKFYLSFENSLCVDYVTEKLLNVFNLNSIVPVVRGGANYDHLFPADSVINVKDFSSPKKLAEYLKQLANNEEEFVKRLQWVWQYEVHGPKLPLCHLCQAIHMTGPVSCVYENVHQWWTHNACIKPNDI